MINFKKQNHLSSGGKTRTFVSIKNLTGSAIPASTKSTAAETKKQFPFDSVLRRRKAGCVQSHVPETW